jgi:hypothetical protein
VFIVNGKNLMGGWIVDRVTGAGVEHYCAVFTEAENDRSIPERIAALLTRDERATTVIEGTELGADHGE